MLTLVVATVLYVAGFVFLYGVIRVSVRHALEDLELRRTQTFRPGGPGAALEEVFPRESAFTGGS